MSKVYKFDCGARLVYEKNKANKVTDISIDFRCGSSCDGEKAGLAHFTEHMFFTGTKSQNKQEISKEYFDFVDVNAYTNTKYIKFCGDVFTNELGQYLSCVAKLISESTFSQKNVDGEKKVVLQEIVEDSDRYSRVALRELAYQLYSQDYLRNGVLGNKKSVESITSKDVKDFVKKYFVANNCDIFVVSTLSFEKVKRLVGHNLLKKLSINTNLPNFDNTNLVVTDKWIATNKKADIDKNFLSVAFKFNFGYNEHAKLAILDTSCGAMSNITDGVLKELRLEKGLVYSGGFYIDINKDNIALIFKTELSRENIKETLTILSNYLKRVKDKGIEEELIKQEHRTTKYVEESSIDTPRNVCSDLTSIKSFGKVVTSHEENAMRLAVSKQDVDNIIRENIGKTNVICCVYGNAEKTDCISTKELKDLFSF